MPRQGTLFKLKSTFFAGFSCTSAAPSRIFDTDNISPRGYVTWVTSSLNPPKVASKLLIYKIINYALETPNTLETEMSYAVI